MAATQPWSPGGGNTQMHKLWAVQATCFAQSVPSRFSANAGHGSADTRELSEIQRRLNRAVNERQSGRVIAGLVLLLTLCSWVSGGAEGVRNAVTGGMPTRDRVAISPDIMRRRFGARLLHPSEMPALFHILERICHRARLPRLPDIYVLPVPNSMNAYALGGPEGSTISLTEGLLRGMTTGEVAAILAHEIAHICNDDGWTMSWGTALHRAITCVSAAGLMSLPARDTRAATANLPLILMLRAAPMIAELLCLALSRIRELDADALALELIDDPQAFVTALEKLEYHHNASQYAPMASIEDGFSSFLRSHPGTGRRIGILRSLG